VPDSK